MTGKDKCEFLKEIRKTIAKKNDITYTPRQCHHEEECSGTCPLCESEAAALLAELKKKAQKGEEIQIDKDTIKFLELVSCTDDEFSRENIQQKILCRISQGDFDKQPMNDEEKRIKEERLYREAIEREIERLKVEKHGIWNAIKRNILDFFTPPTTMGYFEDNEPNDL